MIFPEALTELFANFRMARSGWNGKGMWIEVQHPDARSKMSAPYLFINTVSGDRVPWLPSQSDIFADDWGYVSLTDTFVPLPSIPSVQ